MYRCCRARTTKLPTTTSTTPTSTPTTKMPFHSNAPKLEKMSISIRRYFLTGCRRPHFCIWHSRARSTACSSCEIAEAAASAMVGNDARIVLEWISLSLLFFIYFFNLLDLENFLQIGFLRSAAIAAAASLSSWVQYMWSRRDGENCLVFSFCFQMNSFWNCSTERTECNKNWRKKNRINRLNRARTQRCMLQN